MIKGGSDMKPKLFGVYKHFKGNRYRVLEIAQHTETDEIMVIYQEVGNPRYPVWARPLSMFNEEVEVDGKLVPRFKYMGGGLD